MNFGAMDNVFGKTRPPAFERAAALGFEGVEVNLKPEDLEDGGPLRRDVEAAGLPVPSLVLGRHNHGGIAAPWLAEKAAREIETAVDLCSTLGVKTLLVPFFFWNEPKGRRHRDDVAAKLKPLCNAAAGRGVTIAYEGVMRADHLREMATQIGDGFGVYYDPANLAWCDLDPAAEFRTLGDLVVAAHVKDTDAFAGDARLGEGRVDHAAVAAAMREVGYDGWLTLETKGGDATADELAFARRVYAQG